VVASRRSIHGWTATLTDYRVLKAADLVPTLAPGGLVSPASSRRKRLRAALFRPGEHAI
jgi:hypothetical protein